MARLLFSSPSSTATPFPKIDIDLEMFREARLHRRLVGERVSPMMGGAQRYSTRVFEIGLAYASLVDHSTRLRRRRAFEMLR